MQSPDFYDENGRSRILYFWNQPMGRDAVITSEEIDRGDFYGIQDVSGHGTIVARIAAGGAGTGGAAPGAKLIVIRLDEISQTSGIMEAVDYSVKIAEELNMPLVINLSYGNNMGSHYGDDILSTFLSEVVVSHRVAICCGMGNEGSSKSHASGNFREDNKVEFAVDGTETSLYLKLWKNFADQVNFSLSAPDGTVLQNLSETRAYYEVPYKDNMIYAYLGMPSPISIRQQLQLEFIKGGAGTLGGIWSLNMEPIQIVEGHFDIWLPESAVLNINTGFLKPDEFGTLTNPAASKVISVGAVNARDDSYAVFSGRGFRQGYCNSIKPDVSAPGVEIATINRFGRPTVVSGTSFATPFVSGICALIMEWGIVKGNDPNLYGEKLKAFLLRYAARPRFSEGWPNSFMGWGIIDRNFYKLFIFT